MTWSVMNPKHDGFYCARVPVRPARVPQPDALPTGTTEHGA